MPNRNVSEWSRMRLVKLRSGSSQQWHTFSSPCALVLNGDESAQTARKEDCSFTPFLKGLGLSVCCSYIKSREHASVQSGWAWKTFNQSFPEDSVWTTQLPSALLTSQRASIVSFFGCCCCSLSLCWFWCVARFSCDLFPASSSSFNHSLDFNRRLKEEARIERRGHLAGKLKTRI